MENKENFHKPEDDPEKAMQEFEGINNWHENELIQDIFNADMHDLRISETPMFLLPAGISAHTEVVAVYGMGKKCIYIGVQK